MITDLNALLKRGLVDIIKSQELDDVLDSSSPIRVYLGVDPTGPKIHLGHMVILRKLAILQKMGHKVIFLIGDFTAKIGDPTDREKMRQPLTSQEVLENTKDYIEQVNKVLPVNDEVNPVEIRHNGEWHNKETKADFLNHAYLLTVSQLMERDMFQERLKKGEPISLAEFIYPYLQGYDAVILEADAQIGGTDQTFNMLMGRTLRQKMAGKNQIVLTVPLILGTDGRKMSKSYHNTINVTDEPNDIFGKIMSMDDSQIKPYYELLTDLSEAQLASVNERLSLEPRQLKVELAKDIISQIYDSNKAQLAHDYFETTFVKKDLPDTMQEINLSQLKTKNIIELMCMAGFAESNSQAQRLIEQGGVTFDGAKVTDAKLELNTAGVLQVGKRNFIRLIINQ